MPAAGRGAPPPSSPPLRILQLYPKADYFTGAAIQLRDLAVGLAARGHAVTVATPASELWAERMAAAGVGYVPIPMQRAWDVRAAWRLAKVIRAREIQVAHAHKGRARTLALLAGLMGARSKLVLNRGVSFHVPRLRRVGYTSRRVHAIVAVCESIKRDLVATGVPAQKIEVIYSGTDVLRFHPGLDGQAIRRELGLSAEHFLITQIGVRSWRGWSDVLEAMTRIAPAAPRARLLFVGAPPPRIVELGERARERGLDGRVLVLGHREDVPQILTASDVVVDASRIEPVVATDLAGMPELVVDGETGLLVPPRDPDALAQALRRVLENPTWAQTMARAGCKRVDAHFSLRAKLDATEALYRRLVETSAA